MITSELTLISHLEKQALGWQPIAGRVAMHRCVASSVWLQERISLARYAHVSSHQDQSQIIGFHSLRFLEAARKYLFQWNFYILVTVSAGSARKRWLWLASVYSRHILFTRFAWKSAGTSNSNKPGFRLPCYSQWMWRKFSKLIETRWLLRNCPIVHLQNCMTYVWCQWRELHETSP